MRYRALLTVAAASAMCACRGTTDALDPAIEAGLPACAPGTSVFTTPPIKLDSMAGWVPLGALNPPAHTFPTDHQYLYLPFTNIATVPTAVGVVAPGHVFVTRAKRTTYSTRSTSDYAVEFSPCTAVHGEFGHLQSLTASLLDRIGAFDQNCQTYSPDPATTVTSCYSRNIGVELAAGEAMGTAGGVAGVFGLDFLLFDNRITPLAYANDSRWPASENGFDHFHVVPASDYFAEPAKTQIAAKLGSYDGAVPRTAAPVGGTIATDVATTVQGTWFSPLQATYPESPHLAIVPDNVDPSKFAFSFGTSQPGLASGVRMFTPAASGNVNRHPTQVGVDNRVYCYEFAAGGPIVLVRLRDATTLRVEARTSATSCGPGPFAFAGPTVDYVR